MATFSMNEAWNEGIAFIRNNLPMVTIWAAIGVLVPSVLQISILGGVSEQQAMLQQMMAAGDPSTVLAAMGGGMFLVVLVSAIASTASYFGPWRMGLAREVVHAPQAAVYALGASLLSLLFFLLLVILLAFVIAIPLGLLGFMDAAGGADGQPGIGGVLAAAGIGLLMLLVILPLSLWLTARLSVFGPAMAAAGSINPLYGVAQSWRLTRPSQWAILGYLVLLFIALIVVSMVVGLISGVGMMAFGGLADGEIGTGSLIFTTLLGAIIGIPTAIAYIGIPAGIYRALNPKPVADVFN
jgi:hypothetical protein